MRGTVSGCDLTVGVGGGRVGGEAELFDGGGEVLVRCAVGDDEGAGVEVMACGFEILFSGLHGDGGVGEAEGDEDVVGGGVDEERRAASVDGAGEGDVSG